MTTILLALLTSLAWAQEGRLPQLVAEVPADFDPADLGGRSEAVVLLEIDVDERGRVLDARVVEGAGGGLDAAALAAALDFRFEPALDARGRPAAARIRYAYRFTAEALPVERVRGMVLEKGIQTPVPGMVISMVGVDGQERRALSDEAGAFRFVDLPDGTYTLVADAPGFETQTVEVVLESGKLSQLELLALRARPWQVEVDEEFTIVGRRVAPEVNESVISAEQVKLLPGTNGDLVRVVQNLPGVARPPLGIGQLIVRGTSPEDTRYYIDGQPLPLVFHFAGLSTVVNADSVREVAFLPGGYGVRYGRSLGGVVDLRTDTNLPERDRAYLSVDVYQSTAFVSKKLGENTALSLSGRRSYIDAVLTPILRSATGSGTRAPRYWDTQARLLHQSDRWGTVDATLLVSDDTFRIVGAEDEDGEANVAIGLSDRFAKGRVLWTRELGDGWRNELSVIAGPERRAFVIAPAGEAYEKPLRGALREELYRDATAEQLGWRIGTDIQAESFRFLYDVPAFGAREESAVKALYPAGYVEMTLEEGAWRYTPGLRADALLTDQGYAATTVDPRFSLQRDAGGPWTFHMALGRYAQWPTLRQIDAENDGNPNLGAQRQVQTNIGFGYKPAPDWNIEVNRYYGWLDRLVVGREDKFEFFSGPPPFGISLDTGAYANEGVGRVAGVEARVVYQNRRTIAWVSGTLSHSVRQKRRGGDEALFRYDQPLTLTALGSYELARGWRVGGRVRYGSGNPYTPVVNRVYDLNERSFIPVYGDAQSERTPAFFSADLRIDKEYVLRNMVIGTYLDLQNATNRANPELMNWNYDYSEETPVNGLPLLPAFGLRGEW